MANSNSIYSSNLAKYSDHISIVRVLSILLMSYAHYDLASYTPQNNVVWNFLDATLYETLARASVPILSVVSGYLMYGVYLRKPYKTLVSSRTKALLLPMVFWNIFTLIVFYFVFKESLNLSFFQILDKVFALTEVSTVIALSYLRDLFVLSLITPILVYLIKHYRAVTMAVVLFLYVTDTSIYIVLRTQILFFYFVGIVVATSNLDIKAVGSVRFGVYILLLLVFVVEFFANYYPDEMFFTEYQVFDNIVKRPVVTLCLWFFVLDIKLRSRRFISICRYISPCIFTFFLMHIFLFRLLNIIFQKFGVLDLESNAMLVWFFMPFMGLLISIVIFNMARILPLFFGAPLVSR